MNQKHSFLVQKLTKFQKIYLKMSSDFIFLNKNIKKGQALIKDLRSEKINQFFDEYNAINPFSVLFST